MGAGARLAAAVLTTAVVLGSGAGAAHSSASLASPPAPAHKPAKLDGRVAALGRSLRRSDALRAAGRRLRRADLRARGRRPPSADVREAAPRIGLASVDGAIRVSVAARDVVAGAAALRRAGASDVRELGGRFEALVPAGALDALSADPAIAFVAAAPRAQPLSVAGEGVAASGATAWHAAGIDGAGVTVAVIDAGFGGLATAKASGDLPASTVDADRCGGGFSTAGSHGTAVAEVVHELAPAAKLVLVCSSGVAALGTAKDFAIAQGASIINYSAGFYNQSRGDGLGGPGTPDAIVADARAKGVLWVAAAGNSADTHWSGPFAGANAHYHDWVPGDRLNRIAVDGGQLGCAYLRWDDWPVSDQDFDLYLVDGAGNFVSGGQGAGAQTGTQPPTEAACVRNDGPDTDYGIAIWRRNATETPRMDVIVGNGVGPFEHAVAHGSIADPAASPAAFAAAAICWQTNALEPYSSRGPTLDGRTKPDISGQVNLSTLTFGPFAGCADGFAGTSAAAPSVTGAAALVQQALPGAGPQATIDFLQARAVDLGAPGRDNDFGAGALSLGAPPVPPRPPAPQTAATPSDPASGTAPASALRGVRVLCRRSRASARRRITCAIRPAAAVRSVGARLVRGSRTVALLRPRRLAGGRFTIGGFSRPLRAGRYRVVVVLRDRRGNARTVRVVVRV